MPLKTLLWFPSHSHSTASRVPHVLTSATGGLRLISYPGPSALVSVLKLTDSGPSLGDLLLLFPLPGTL